MTDNSQQENVKSEKISNTVFLLSIIGLFIILFAIIGICFYKYFDKVDSLINIEECLKNIKITEETYKTFTLKYNECLKNVKLIKTENHLIEKYYTIRSEWLDKWLAFTAIILSIVTVIMPIIAKKNNERFEDKTDSLFKESRELIKECDVAEKRIIEKENIINNIKNELTILKEKTEHKFKIILMRSDVNNLFNLGYLYSSLEEYDNGIKNYEKALEKLSEIISYDKNEKDYVLRYESMLNCNIGANYGKQNNYDEAIKYFDRALNLQPSNTIALSNRAGCYATIKEYGKAISDYELYMKLFPNEANNSNTYYNLIESYIFTNQIYETINYLKKYLTRKDSFIYNNDIQLWKDGVEKSTATPEQKEEINKLIDQLCEKWTKHRPD